MRNLIRHYPVFKKNAYGFISLQPLNPLPSNVSYKDWADYIGFDKHPCLYFQVDQGNTYAAEYGKYYGMSILGCTDSPCTEHLGPRYSAEENPTVATTELLPIWTRLNFGDDPLDAQPICVLRYFLLNRGVPTTEDDTIDKLRAWVRRAIEVQKRVFDPSKVLKPVKWVGFEALDDLELGDKYDDWVS